MHPTELFELKALDLSKKLYVVVVEKRDGTQTLLMDPGMDKPWSTRNQKLANDTADEAVRLSNNLRKAAAMTLEDAFSVLHKHLIDTYAIKRPSRR